MDPRKDPSNSRPAGHHQTPQGELGRVLLLFGENRQVLQAMEENEEGCRGRQGASGRINYQYNNHYQTTPGSDAHAVVAIMTINYSSH